MRYSQIYLLVLFSLIFGCQQKDVRSTASVGESLNTQGSSNIQTSTEINLFYQSLVKSLDVKVADGSGRFYSHNCDEDEKTSCIEIICSKRAYDCKVQFDLNKVIKACETLDSSQTNCLDVVCDQGGYNCSDSFDMRKVIGKCQESNGQCVKVVCSQGGYACKDSFDLNKVIAICQKVDYSESKCIKGICSQGGYNCKDSFDLNKVITMCKSKNKK